MQILQILWAMFTSKRFKSFYWRTAMMFIAGLLALITENLNLLQLTPTGVVVTGLILGELSKGLNNFLSRS